MLLVTGAGQYFRGYDQYIRPIHMAAYEARPDLMRLLLTNGASVDAPDRKGRTPVQCVLAPTFFDDKSLVGKPSKTTARQRLTLQVLHLLLQSSAIPFPGHLHHMLECTKDEPLAQKETVLAKFGEVVTICIVAMVSMSSVKKCQRLT